MQDVATSVRINSSAMDILSSLAAKLGQPKAQIIEIALRELEERTFWADVQRAFEQAASDPLQSGVRRTEIALWDKASQQDFQDAEKW